MKINVRVLALLAIIALMLVSLAVPVFAEDVTEGFQDDTASDIFGDNPEDTTVGSEETTGDETETKPAGIGPETIVPIIIFAAIVIGCIIFFFASPARRERSLKYLRSLKSECKKVSWYTWKQTWKGSLVVLITVAILATAIGLLDLGFSEVINALGALF